MMMDMEFYLANAPYIWLIAGALLLALEAFGASGIGFLFAGIGAILTGIIAESGVAGTLLAHIAWFFGATSLSAIVLWKPMQRWVQHRKAGQADFSNIIGNEAMVIAGGLEPGKRGKVRWSGTTMQAQLAPQVTEPVDEGTVVIISEVKSNLLVVKPQI